VTVTVTADRATLIALVGTTIFILAPLPLYRPARRLFAYLIWAVPSATFLFTVLTLVGRNWSHGWALAIALPADAAMVTVVAKRFLAPRRLRRACDTLERTNTPEALLEIEGALENLRKAAGGGNRADTAWAAWTLHAAARAYKAGHAQRALAWCSRIDETTLDRALRATRAQHVTAFRLAAGDRAGARRELARAPRPAGAFEAALLAQEGLLDALEPQPNDRAVVARAERALGEKLDPAIRATWRAALAHARVAMGQQAEAREVLLALRLEEGPRALERIVAHGGPASELAVAVLRSDGPYRGM
jgi:hypothetical protein